MAPYDLKTIPQDWLQDIAIFLDFSNRHRLRRCCRKWKDTLSSKYVCGTLLIHRPMTFAIRTVRPVAAHAPVSYKHNPPVLRAITAMTMDIRNIIFVGQLITSEAFINCVHKNSDAYFRQYHGWLLITRMLTVPYPVFTDQLTTPETLSKTAVFYHDIPHLPWHVIQRCWAADRVARIEIKNTTIVLDYLWSKEYLAEVFLSFSTDPWMKQKYDRLRAGKLGRLGAVVFLERRLFDLSVVSFGEFLQEFFPAPDAQQMALLLARLKLADQTKFGRVLRHIENMTGYRHAPGIVPNSESASRLGSLHPIVLWFLYAWIILN